MRSLALILFASLAASCSDSAPTAVDPDLSMPKPRDMAMSIADMTVVPSCTDNLKNGTESDIDCGGSTCQKCGLDKVCTGAADCASGSCVSNLCKTMTTCAAGMQILTASAMFQLPAGCSGSVRALVVGGGGNGGAYPGSGGGSGFVKSGTFNLTGPIQVTIGAAGQASSLGTLLTANAGSNGGGGDNSTGGAGGSSGGGKYSGFQGGRGGMNGGKGGERTNELDNGGATSQGAPFPIAIFTRATIKAGTTPNTNVEGGGGGGGIVINGSTVKGANSQQTGMGGEGYGAGGGGGTNGTGAPGVVYIEWDQ